MPGNDPGGIIVTMLLGIVGTLIGGFIGSRILGRGLETLWNLQTWIVAIIGSLILLIIYRLAVGTGLLSGEEECGATDLPSWRVRRTLDPASSLAVCLPAPAPSVCDDAAVAMTDRHSTETSPTRDTHSSPGVDPHDEPSAAWGWHGGFPRAGKIAGWFTAFALFAMIIGNREGNTEVVYLVCLGTLLVVMLIASHVKAYKQKRRWRD